MENIALTTGIIIPKQTPLDSKGFADSETTLKNLGLNNNLAYTYYDGLNVFCKEEKTWWEWREVVGIETGLLLTHFLYTDGTIGADGIDYSLKFYNFFKPSELVKKVDKEVNKSLVSNTEIAKLVNLDNTKDVDKPVSNLQEIRIQAVVAAQITDSTALSDPTIAIVPTGNVHILGVGPGTYPYWGGMVIPDNNQGTLRRVGGVYSVSLTPIDLSGKVNVSDVVDNLTSTDENKPLSANQGKVLKDKFEYSNQNVYTDKSIANTFIKEIYLLGDWGINGVYIDEFRKHHAYGTNVIFKNEGGAIIFNTSFTDDELLPGVVYKKDGAKEFYAIFNWDYLSEGGINYGINALINKQGYSLDYSPSIKDFINIKDLANKESVLKLQSLNLKLESDNLISKFYTSKWIDPVSIGTNFYDAIPLSTNSFGIVAEPVWIGDGKSVTDSTGKDYRFFYNNGSTVYDNTAILELDSDGIILTRNVVSVNTLIRSSDKVQFVVLQYPQGYGNGSFCIVQGTVFKSIAYNPKVSVGGDRLSALREVNQWFGKKVCTFGNSITQYGFWQDSVIKFFGFGTHYMRGVSGAKVSNIDPFYYWANSDGSLHSFLETNPTQPVGTHQVWSNYSADTRIATIPLDSDLIIVMGGTNDSGVVVIGDMLYSGSSFDESVFKGGLAETIRKIQVRCPDAIIVVATPLSGLGSAANYVANGNGDTIADFALAVKDVAFRMSTPCIDIFGNCGINPQNRTEYLREDNVHPTYGTSIADNDGTGSAMIARAMIGGLKGILPKDAMLTFITSPIF